MEKRLAKFLKALAGVFCLAIGVLLWRNLTLHFAQIEQVLPQLRPADLYRGKGSFLILIVLSTGLGALLTRRLPWNALFGGIGRPLRTPLAVFLIVLTFIPIFWLRFGGAAWLILILMGLSFFCSLIGILEISSWFASVLPDRRRTIPVIWNRLQPWLPAGLLLLAAIYFSGYCFLNLPHIEDSIAQLLQARIFASGEVFSTPFEPKEFFFFGFMADSGRWFSQYPPGHPLMLALGVLVGLPQLVNPLLGAACVILLFLLLKEHLGFGRAVWGAWALAVSPFVIFMSSEFMNHSMALAATLLGWLALKKGEEGRVGWLLLAGLSFGYCAATRPLEGIVFAAIGGLFILSNLGWKNEKGWFKTLPYAAGFLLTASLYLAHNALTTGHAFRSGYSATWGSAGFGLGSVNWGPPHTLGYGFINTFMSLAGLNVFLWEIPMPALSAFFLWAILGDRLSRWDKAFLAAAISIPAAYLFYYFHDYSFGSRYYYVILPQVIYFSIKGIQALRSRLEGRLNLPPGQVKRGLIVAGLILLALQMVVAVPYRASVYADAYWGTDDGPMREAKRLNLKHAVIFIENHPWEILMTNLHALGFIMGDAYRFIFLITPEGLDQVLQGMNLKPDELWNAKVDRWDLEQRIYEWNRNYMKSGNPPVNPWAEGGFCTYFSNGAVHLDPRDRDPDIVLARDLGTHNRRLMEIYPDRRYFRFAWSSIAKRFTLEPLNE
jgi:hypothetical protein